MSYIKEQLLSDIYNAEILNLKHEDEELQSIQNENENEENK